MQGTLDYTLPFNPITITFCIIIASAIASKFLPDTKRQKAVKRIRIKNGQFARRIRVNSFESHQYIYIGERKVR